MGTFWRPEHRFDTAVLSTCMTGMHVIQELKVESSCSKDEMNVLLDRVMNGGPPQEAT
jgi:hypothetical protein